ncbi:MAG TPA: penicillin-binding protein 2 [Chloroflexota bacterium]
MKKRTKFLLLRSIIILVFALLSGRIWYVQIVMGSYYKHQGDTSKIRLEPVMAMRGIIYDRTGTVPLVYNYPSWNITIVPHGIPTNGAQQIYATLSSLLGGHPSAARIAWMVQNYEWQAYAPFVVKKDVSIDTAMIVKQLHLRLPGVEASPSSVRRYMLDPQMTLSHILGYAGTIDQQGYATYKKIYPAENVGFNDTIGREGIEQALDPYLHGVNGTARVEVDAGERPIRTLSPGKTVAGDSVNLTIDWKLQQKVAGDLVAALNKLGVHQGAAIVENVHTGEILSMVSLPSYNNNWFSGGISNARYASLLHAPGYPLDDLATGGQLPPGSTFKIVTAAAALQSGVANASTTIDDTGQIKLEGHTFFGWKPGGLGPMNVVSALSHSSDIYMYTVAGGNPITGWGPGIGANRLAWYAHLFGLGQSSNVELPDQAGFIPSRTWYDNIKPGTNPIRPSADYTWHIGDTYNMAIGQGYDLATPLQMVNVAATIANGGTLYSPRIIERVVGRVIPRRGVLPYTQVIQPFVPTVVRRNFINQYNLSLIQQGMHESVTLPNWEGTSYLAQDPRVDAAGKTGTAEDNNPRPPDSWWVGYAPFNNPQIAVVVTVPHAGGEGAYVSAPIAHKIFEDYLHLPPAKPKTPGPCGCWLDDVQPILVGTGGSQ